MHDNRRISTIQEHKLWCSDDPPHNNQTMTKTNGIPLDQTYKRIQQYDKDMCAVWRDEIEHLLIFAALFSAIIAAFVLNACTSLQRDSGDVSAQLLSQISLQLSAIANNATPVSPSTILDQAFIPSSGNIRSSIFLITSLATCMSTAGFSILILQWLREYTRPISLSPADAIIIRQMRYDALVSWWVPMLVYRLPELLLLSIFLFSVGLLDFLWSLDRSVALFITCCTGVGFFLLILMNFAPSLQVIAIFVRFMKRGYDSKAYLTPCPYRSPLPVGLSRIFMKLGRWLFKKRPYFKKLWAELEDFNPEWSIRPSHGRRTNVKALAQALKWIIDELSPECNQVVLRDVYYWLHDDIDRDTSIKVLKHWAELTGELSNLKTTLEDLDTSGMHQAQRDLLMERLLRKSSPVQENRKLLLELQVRCLNTLGNWKTVDMGDVFLEAARNCSHYLLENKDANSVNKNGLLFQTLMTLMTFYDHLYDDRRTPNVNDHIVSVLDIVMRHTEVKDENASLCYQLLNQFQLMLEKVYQSAGRNSTLAKNENLRSIVQLLHGRFDLGAIKKWEMDIQEITRNDVSLVDGITGSVGRCKARQYPSSS